MGSPETFIKQTASQVNSEAFENHYLLFTTGPLYDELTAAGANVHLLSQPPRLLFIADRQKVQDKLKELINALNIDLVHSTSSLGAIYSAWTCRQMGVPHVWFQHSPASGWKDRLAAILPHKGLIVNSHYTGKTQRRIENPIRFLIPRNNPIEKILLGTPIIEIPSAEVQAEKSRLAQKHNFNTDAFVASMLCRVQERKGLHVFLSALIELKKQNKLANFQALLWGEQTPGNEAYFGRLNKTIIEHQLPVAFAGRAKHPSLALACSDTVVNASVQPEPFGLSIIEGMMVGAVPIVPNEGGPTEIVSHGKNGLVFRARQASSLAQQLETLMKDADLKNKLAESTQTSARQKYNSERAIGHLETFHLKVINN